MSQIIPTSIQPQLFMACDSTGYLFVIAIEGQPPEPPPVIGATAVNEMIRRFDQPAVG